MNPKWEAYAHIEKSKSFAKADLSLKIIKYLVEADEKGEKPSSAQIAFDILGKDGEVYKDPVSFMRVQIHHIRKKLDIYYLSEGKNDPLHISIPKESYEIEFTGKNTTENTPSKKKKKSLLVPILAGTLFISLIIITLLSILLLNTPASSTNQRLSPLKSNKN